MEARVVDKNGLAVALVDGGVTVSSAQDMLDLIATLRYEHRADALVLPKACLSEDFFDLRTGLAGEVLQKCANYQMKIAIVGDFSGYTSQALRDFIRESNRGASVFFLPTEAEALAAF